MTMDHWLFLGAIALLTALLLCFSLNSRPQSRGYRLARRIFWALIFLQAGSALRWVGVNAVSLAVTALLGAPGYAALLVFSALK